MSRNIKKKSLLHSHQPCPWATILQVSFISSAICIHICVLHIHTACSYYYCSHSSLLHSAHSILSPYPSHCMLTYDYWSCLVSYCMLVSWDVFFPILMPPNYSNNLLPWPGRGRVWAPDSWPVTFIDKEPQTPWIWYGSMWRKTDYILQHADYLWWQKCKLDHMDPFTRVMNTFVESWHWHQMSSVKGT